jgi:hypothetical protein
MTSQKPEWFRMTENDAPPVAAPKVRRKMTFAAVLATSALVLGGAVFANAHDEESAQAETPSVTSSTTPTATPTAPTVSSSQTPPAIGNVPNSGVRPRHEGEEREHEGRERHHPDGDYEDHDRYSDDD